MSIETVDCHKRANELTVNAGLLFNNPYVAATGTPATLSIEGHKQSGNGFEAGVDGLAEYSICTAVYQVG